MPSRSRERAAGWGLTVTAAGFLAGCLAFAAVSPLLGSADEPLHVDYAFQVWQGQLPVFEAGPVLRPEGITLPPVQWVAQHPPLFYLLLAPVVGPLVDAGHLDAAVLAARLVCALIALAALAALAWAAAQLPTRRPGLWALTTAAVAAPLVPFLRVGGSVYSDDLAALCSALALGLALRVLRRGWSSALLAALAAVAAAGALTRATFVVTLVTVSAGLLVGGGRFARGGTGRRLAVGAGLAVLPWAAAALAAGWFYRRNAELSGSWTGGHPDWAMDNLGRSPSSILDVLLGDTLWRIPLDLLRQSPEHLPALGTVLLVGLPLVAVVGAVVRRTLDREALLAIGPLGMQAVGVLAMTALYLSQGGGTAGRYLLPALLPIALVLAAGLITLGRAVGVGLLVYGVLAWLPFAWWLLDQPGGASGETANGFPVVVVPLLLGVIGLTTLGQAWAATRTSATPERAVDHAAPRGSPPVEVGA